MIGQDVVDEGDVARAIGGDVPARQRQLGDVAPADDARQALERTEVGDDRDLGLAHREDGVGRRQPDVARGDEVDAAPDAVAVHGGEDGLGTVGHRVDRALQAPELAQHRRAPAGVGPALTTAGHGAPHALEIEADGEARATRRDHHDPYVVVLDQLGHHHGQVVPERRPQGVAPIGVVEPQRPDVAVALDGQDARCRGHAAMLCRRSASATTVEVPQPPGRWLPRVQGVVARSRVDRGGA